MLDNRTWLPASVPVLPKGVGSGRGQVEVRSPCRAGARSSASNWENLTEQSILKSPSPKTGGNIKE